MERTGMRRLLFLLLLLPAAAFAQLVPNGGIIPGQSWSVIQWNHAWQSKVDNIAGVCAGCTFTNPAITAGSLTGTDATNANVTIGGVTSPLFVAIGSGGGGGGPTFTQQITRTVTATAYGNNQAVGGLMTFNASARSPAYSGNVTGMVLNLPDAQTPTLDVWLFNANPTSSTFTNGQAVVLASADQAKRFGILNISNCTGTPTICQSQQDPIGFSLLSTTSTTLYAVIVARNSFAPSNLPVGAPAWLVSLITQQN